MQTILRIEHAIAKQIFDTMVKMFKQLGIKRFAYIGIIDTQSNEVGDVYCFITPSVTEDIPIQETLVMLKEGKRGMIGDRFIVNTFPGMAAVKVGELIVICHSQVLQEANEAVAIIYGLYHNLVQMRGSIVDDVFSDMLLCHLGQWQKNNRQKNEIVLSLAQTIFKPEAAL